MRKWYRTRYNNMPNWRKALVKVIGIIMLIGSVFGAVAIFAWLPPWVFGVFSLLAIIGVVYAGILTDLNSKDRYR